MDNTAVIVRACTIADIATAPGFAALAADYAAAGGLPGLPPPCPDVKLYEAMEGTGNLQAFGAFSGPQVIGFLLTITTIMPHYGVPVSGTESFFVAQNHRSSNAGWLLYEAARSHARLIGSYGLLVSAPVGKELDAIMPAWGGELTNRVYFVSVRP